jgi:hypothetical protein
MGASGKLNQFYALGCLGLAAVAGVVTGSWPVFWGTLAVTVGGCLDSGEIRTRSAVRRNGPRKKPDR